MRIIVVYNSKTGFTEEYGRWIAEKLDCKAVSYKEYMGGREPEHDLVIYGGWLMASKITGLDKIKAGIGNRKLVVYATGATPADAAEVIDKIQKDNFTEEEQRSIPFFYLPGGIRYEKMGFFSKRMLRFLHRMLEKKNDRTEEETGMMNALERSCNNSGTKYIVPLTECVGKMGYR